MDHDYFGLESLCSDEFPAFSQKRVFSSISSYTAQEEEEEDAQELPLSIASSPGWVPLATIPLSPIQVQQMQPVKKVPTTKKALQMLKHRTLFNAYSPQMPLLTMRPMLKNADDAFGYIINVLDAILFHWMQANPSMFVQILHETEFMKPCVAPKDLVCAMQNTRKPWFASLSTLGTRGKHEQVALYYDTYNKSLIVIDFGYVKDLTLDKVQSLLGTTKMPIEMKSCHMFVNVAAAPQGFEMQTSTKQKLWNALLVCMVVARNMGPLQVLEDLEKQPAQDNAALLQLFTQSMLYYVFDNEEAITSYATRYHARQMPQTMQLINSIKTQCNTKPVVPLKKAKTDRIGKFKGKQLDNLFCIVINNVIGVYVSFEKLFTMNLFELLVQNSQCPNESEFDYEDLHKKLPVVFPKNQDHRFGSQFQVKTPFLMTRDPQVCFGPLRNLLWPDARTASDIVMFNGKTWKLEFQLEHVTAETTSLSKFINNTELGPRTILKCKWNDWVCIVDENNIALDIYYHDPTHSLEHATEQLNRHKGLEVTAFQKPTRLCLGAPNSITELYKLRFVKDKYHGLWKGSRTQGIAVRRKYKNNTFCIRTFTNAQEFLTKSECENHGFLLLNDFVTELRVSHPSFVMSTPEQIAELFEKLSSTLMYVEDVGVPKIDIRGHEPLMQFHDCKTCIVSETDELWNRALTNASLMKLDACFDTYVQDCCLAYGATTYVNSIANVAGEPIYAQIKRVAKNAHFSRYVLSCIRGKHIQYLNSFQDLHSKVIDLVYKQMLRFNVTHFHQISDKEYEVYVPNGCECCRTKQLCLQGLANVLLLMDVISCNNIKLVSSTISIMHGKLLQTEPIVANFGLRCKHNWTQGVPNLVFETVVGDHPTPDVMIVYKSENVCGKQHRVLHLL